MNSQPNNTQSANVKLIWRAFSWKRFHWIKVLFCFDTRRYMHWVEKSSGYSQLDSHNYAVDGSGASFWHYRYQVQYWPESYDEIPEFTPLDPRWRFCFMDDLKICPVCHRFHPYVFYNDTDEAVESWLEKAGLKLPGCSQEPLPSTFTADTLNELLGERLKAPEFTVELCGVRLCEALKYKEDERRQEKMIHPRALARIPK